MDAVCKIVNDGYSRIDTNIAMDSLPNITVLSARLHYRIYEIKMLSYMMYCCKTKAKTVFEACISLSWHLSYDGAEQLLHDLFGRENSIACELTMKLLDDKPVDYS